MTDCVFCKIAAKEISSDLVYEGEGIVAFKDIHPKAPVHVLIIPAKHLASLNDAKAEDLALLGKLLITAKHVAQGTGIAKSGYRVILNCGEDGGQVVGHLHMHVLGGRKIGQKGEEL